MGGHGAAEVRLLDAVAVTVADWLQGPVRWILSGVTMMNTLRLLQMVTAASPPEPLADMPIDPAQVTAGCPTARGAVLTQSADKRLSSGLWTCEPGEFDWEYAWDEFVYVLEGQVTVTQEDGKSFELGPGDMAHFPLGLKTHWKVTSAVRKFFVLKTPEPLEM